MNGCTCERMKDGRLLRYVSIKQDARGREVSREEIEVYSMDCPTHGLEAQMASIQDGKGVVE